MDFGFLSDYVVLIVVLICLCIGYVIRNIIPGEKINKFIPLIMAVLGLSLNIWLNSWTVTPEIVLGGLASGLASTGFHQLFKKLIERSNE